MATIKHAPICLIIMDGWGIGDPKDKYNSISVDNNILNAFNHKEKGEENERK